MFRQIFQNIQGIELLPTLTLLFFFTFFVAVFIMAYRLDKKFINYMGLLPLDSDDTLNENKSGDENVTN